MESYRNNPLLKFPPNIIYEVRKIYGLEKPGRMDDAVNILHEWVQKQNHFVKKDFMQMHQSKIKPYPRLQADAPTDERGSGAGFSLEVERSNSSHNQIKLLTNSSLYSPLSRQYLEYTIIMCKGSIEKAKKQIDKLCTLKTLIPKFFTCTNIKEELREVTEKAWFYVLPSMTQDYYRTLIIRIRNTDIRPAVISQFYYYIITVAEYIKANDYCLGYVIVFDYTQVNNPMELLSKLDLVEVQQFVPILTEGYGSRLKGLIYLTESKLINGFINILKTIMSEKISKRIHVYKDFESFYSFIPKELLPLEYGGAERSLERLHDETLELLSSKEHVDYMKEMQQARTDETKRTVRVFNDQYMGMTGTFRRLNVD